MTDPLGDWSYTPILIECFFSAEVSIKNEKKKALFNEPSE